MNHKGQIFGHEIEDKLLDLKRIQKRRKGHKNEKGKNNYPITNSPVCPLQRLLSFSSRLQNHIYITNQKMSVEFIENEKRGEGNEIPGWEVRKQKRSKRWRSCSLDSIPLACN